MRMTGRPFSTSWRDCQLDEKACVLATSSMEVDGEDLLVFLSRHDLEGSADSDVPDIGEPLRSQGKIGISRDLTLHHLNPQCLMVVSSWSFECCPAVQISGVFLSPIVRMTLNIEDLGILPLHCLRVFPRALDITVTDNWNGTCIKFHHQINII